MSHNLSLQHGKRLAGGRMTQLHHLAGNDGPRPAWIRGHARRHQRTSDMDTRWMPACQCGWTFYASVRTLRVADRTHGFHLDRVHASRHHAAS
jgi:hypothetical protein